MYKKLKETTVVERDIHSITQAVIKEVSEATGCKPTDRCFYKKAREKLLTQVGSYYLDEEISLCDIQCRKLALEKGIDIARNIFYSIVMLLSGLSYTILVELISYDSIVLKILCMCGVFAFVGIIIFFIMHGIVMNLIYKLQKSDPYNIRDFELRLINKRFEMQFNEDDIIEKAKGVNFVEKCDSSKV